MINLNGGVSPVAVNEMAAALAMKDRSAPVKTDERNLPYSAHDEIGAAEALLLVAARIYLQTSTSSTEEI